MSDSNQTIEKMHIDDESDSDNDRFVSSSALPDLQEMASYQVALSIWYDYISRSKVNASNKKILCYGDVIDILDLDFCYEKDTDKLIGSLGTPRIIDETLKKCLEVVREETRVWIKCFTYNLFSTNLMHYNIHDFDPNCCVWLPNGKIDYKRTAAKMLTTRGLSEVQKFAIMCEYCLSDEIEGFDIRRLSKIFVKEVNFHDDPLIYYWICRIKNELHKIPLDGFSSTDAVMASKCGESRWTAFEYFWNRLGSDDQISIAKFWLNPSRNVYSQYPQARLLSMMSWHQQRQLLAQIPEQIVLNFCISDSPRAALWAWNHSKDRMNFHQFGEIVGSISQNYTNREEEMIFLIEMWDQAGDERRNYVAETMAEEVINRFSSKRHLSPAAFAFLGKFLSMKSPRFRRDAMFKNAPQFGSHIVYPGMKEILDLCLPSSEDQVEFKSLVMFSDMTKNSCVNLFNEGDFDKLNTIVEFYSADASYARAFRIRLLESRAIIIEPYITDVEKWNKFSEFIDLTYSDNPTWALRTKQQFISTFAKKPDWNRLASLDSVIQIVEMVFLDDQLKSIKKCFLEAFYKVLSSQEYWWHDVSLGEENFQKFIKWCSDGDEKVIADFRNSLNVDTLFDKILFTLDKKSALEGDGFDESLLADLDVYLRWRLSCEEEVKKYKLQRIMKTEDLELFKFLSKRQDLSSLKILFKWLFDDDEEAIRKFKVEKLGMAE